MLRKIQYYLLNLVLPSSAVTFAMLVIVSIAASILGIIIALVLYTTSEDGIYPHKLIHKVLNIVVNILRSIPVIIFIVIMMPISRAITGSGIGFWAGVICLLMVVPPFTTRVFEKNFRDVDRCLIEAGISMGLTKKQILFRVIIHNAVPSMVLSVMFVGFVTLSGTAMLGPIGVIGIGNLAMIYGYKSFNKFIMYSCIIVLIIFICVVRAIGNFVYKKVR